MFSTVVNVLLPANRFRYSYDMTTNIATNIATPLKALVGARVSVVSGPQKVSHHAQIESATRWATTHGCEIVGTFEDLGVSASVPPQGRPDLGPWLSDERSTEWDVIVWSKMDRAFRSTRHCVDFARWAEDRHKVVVFAEDGLKLDYRPGAAKGIDSMMAELFVYLGSFFAQLELNRFKTRAQDSHRVLRTTDRWASGVPPLGYRTVPHPSGKGMGLATDPPMRQLLHQMAGKLLEGWSFIRIAAWLNETGTRTNMDHARMAKGKPPFENPWNVSTVIDALTSPKTQGLKMSKRKLVLDAAGDPIRLAPPTFDENTWTQIQQAAAARRGDRRKRTYTTNPMLGVGTCGVCGASLAQQVTPRTLADGTYKEYRSYRCGRTPVNCKGVSIRAADADRLLEEAFLDAYGDRKVTRRVFVPGEDLSSELEQTRATIDRLRRESDMGLVVTAEDEQAYLERMRALIEKRTKLESEPTRAAEWKTEETAQTYRDAWESTNTPDGRRELLSGSAIRFVLRSSKPVLDWGLEGP